MSLALCVASPLGGRYVLGGNKLVQYMDKPLSIRFFSKLIEFRRETRTTVLIVLFAWGLAIHSLLWGYFDDISWLAAYGPILTMSALLVVIVEMVAPNLDSDCRLPVQDEGYRHVHIYEFSEYSAGKAFECNSEHIKVVTKKYNNLAVYYVLVYVGTLIASYSGPIDKALG
ncbi:hypothetical protein [Vibrio cholerae]|uniref:hypothetical protein n=1 Tax=Vibrio cholerae TaxID=666 RepID=UPI0013C47BFA|nr:hypothetical protein [Vibrio cholerae]